MITFVLGGRRSGKSRIAEKVAINSDKQVHYIATSQSFDSETEIRIKQHQSSRPNHWQTHEEAFELASVISRLNDPSNLILVDCLTMWLTNLLCAEKPIEQYQSQLIQVLKSSRADVVLVSNETGLGIVPTGELTRRYCDEAGLLHQAVAEQSDNVYMVIAGLPMTLKGKSLTF